MGTALPTWPFINVDEGDGICRLTHLTAAKRNNGRKAGLSNFEATYDMTCTLQSLRSCTGQH